MALGLVLAGALGAFGGLAPAASAAPTAVTCGDTISAPGSYLLAADCTGAGITITSSHVKLGLNGHTMTSSATSPSSQDLSSYGVLVDDSAQALSHVKITGPGAIVNYGNGVELGTLDFASSHGGDGVRHSVVSGLRATSFLGLSGIAVSAGTHNTVKNDVASSVVGGVGIGLFPDATGDTVKGNTANNNLNGSGIELMGATNSRVDNNTTNNNTAVGISLVAGASGNTVHHNTALGNFRDLQDTAPGCDSNRWKHDTFITATQTCIH